MSSNLDEMPKVAMVTPSFFPQLGGVEKHVQRLSEQLSKTIHVEVFTLDHLLESRITQETLNGICVNRFKSRRLVSGIEMPPSLLQEKLIDFRPEIIHLHNLHTLIPTAVGNAVQKSNCKLVITPHYHGRSESLLRNQLLKIYRHSLSRVVGLASKVICVSEFEKSLLMRDFALDNEHTLVIPNGIEFDHVAINLNKDLSRLLFVGRLEKYKNVDKIVMALSLLPSERKFTLTIVGDGPMFEYIAKLADRLGLKDKVTMKRNLSSIELAHEYQSAGVFLLPSTLESYGIAVAEALNFGARVIVANAGALGEFAQNGYAKGVELPITVEKIVQSILECYEEGISNRQYPYVSWEMVAERVKRVYASLLSR